MEKMLNFPTLILLSYICRILILGSNIADAIVIISLSALYILHYYFELKREPIVNKDLKDRIIALEEQVSISKEAISSIKLGNSLKR